METKVVGMEEGNKWSETVNEVHSSIPRFKWISILCFTPQLILVSFRPTIEGEQVKEVI